MNLVKAYRCELCGCIDVRYGVHFAPEFVIDAPGYEGDVCPGEPVAGTWSPAEPQVERDLLDTYDAEPA